jgi:MoxR-like ATPase
MRNKFAGTCHFGTCSENVLPGEGYLAKVDEKWVVYCSEHKSAASREDTRLKVEVNKTGGGKHGATLDSSVRDTWVHLFTRNEALYEAREAKQSDEKPLTDLDISEFMHKEFPGANAAAYNLKRVRMYRGTYNAGTHSFKSLGEPDTRSHEYDSDGKRIASNVRSSAVSENRIRELIRKEFANRPVINVNLPEGGKVEVDCHGKHKAFSEVMTLISAGLPILLVGPAGSGKTTLAKQVAEALDARFSFNSMTEGVSESSLLGRTLPLADGSWGYKPAPFVITWRDGGVHLLDEIDASDSNLLVTINAAIANGILSIPFADLEIERNKDTILIAAANTFGTGADRQYVGRNQLDAATLNRFAMSTVEMKFDEDLELAIVTTILPKQKAVAKALLKWALSVREKIDSQKLRRLMSTRDIENCAKLIHIGQDLSQIRARYFVSWSDDEALRCGYDKQTGAVVAKKTDAKPDEVTTSKWGG